VDIASLYRGIWPDIGRYLQVFGLYGGLRPDCHAILPGHLPSPHEQPVRQGYVLQSQIHSLKCPSRSPGLNFEDPWANNRLRKCVKTKGHRRIVLTLGSPEPDSSTTGDAPIRGTPVTITIPYAVPASQGSVTPYWFNSLTGALSQQGITDIRDIVVSPTLHALSFKTTHFTPFYVVEGTAGGTGGGGGGGGCSVSATGNGSVIEFLLPYMALAAVMIILRAYPNNP
jgi:hypothetical protein